MDSHGMVAGWPGEYWIARAPLSEKSAQEIQQESRLLLRQSEGLKEHLSAAKKEWKDMALSQEKDKKDRMERLQLAIDELERVIYWSAHRPVALNRATLYNRWRNGRAGVTQ